HCSLGRGYDIARAYRRDGFAATVECCIHYLTLYEENDVKRLGGKAKINPPVRPRAEVETIGIGAEGRKLEGRDACLHHLTDARR
ncbi:hypothetical protein ACC675_37430, partial [Rhizobium ruizarguesonis]